MDTLLATAADYAIKQGMDFVSSSSEGPSKKRKSEESEEDIKSAQDVADVQPGAAMLPFNTHVKVRNTSIRKFQKRFMIKLYSNGWTIQHGGVPPLDYKLYNGWMNYIPWHATCFYLSPQEYLNIVRNNSYATIKEAKFQMQLRGVRTPFTAGSSDIQDANGNLGFDICRFDRLEETMPFVVQDAPYGENPLEVSNYEDLVNRLYGSVSLSQNNAVTGLPATMIERSITMRPMWEFSNSGYKAPGMNRNINQLCTSIPVYNAMTDCINSNQVKYDTGYCFNQTYRPKNGVISCATTAFAPISYRSVDNVRVKQPTRLETTKNPAPLKADNIMNPLVDQSYIDGAQGDISDYCHATLENYSLFNGVKQEPNYHKMPSLCIGINPKINSDNSEVAAIADFIVTTEIDVELTDQDHLLINLARKADESGYILPSLDDNAVYGGRWNTNENGYPLKDKKRFYGGYGAYGMPIFVNSTT